MVESNHEAREASTFVLGMMIGFVLGSALGLWMAPRSGSATRSDLRMRAQFVAERLQGESIEDSLELGRAIAHQKRAELARDARPDVDAPGP